MKIQKNSMVHLRVNTNLKNDVKRLSDSMGVSLSLVAETLFKNFLEEKRLEINSNYIPNDNLKKILQEAEKNKDNPKFWKESSSVENLISDLKK